MSSSSPPHGGDPSSSTGRRDGSGTGNGSRRRRRRRRPPTPPPPPSPPPSPPPPPPPPPHEQPSTSSYDVINGGVWPEPFVEALAIQVALDAFLSIGRLSVAPSLAMLFQVCATWRAVSRSELLWQNLVRLVWNRTNLLHPTWRDEFIFRHRTARNFRICRCSYIVLRPSDHPPVAAIAPGGDEGGAVDQPPLICLRLALSHDHLAAGFSDGSVRLFHLPSRVHLRTFLPLLRDRLGLFSRAVSGILLLTATDSLVFASVDGDIHIVSPFRGPGPVRRAYLGDVVNDGVLVDFAGCERFWVGLYAGVPGQAFRVWNAESEELIFVGGSLTDPDSVTGWHMLTDLQPTEPLGRIRVAAHGLAIGFTSLRYTVLNLEDQAVAVIREEAPRRGVVVGSADAANEAFVNVDTRGLARVRRTRTLDEICRFPLRGTPLGGLLGCMNTMYVLIYSGGILRVWDAEHGEYLYRFRERIGEATTLTASDQHVAASTGDTTIHLWDFGA